MTLCEEIDISDWEYRDVETMGKHLKDWYRDPSTGRVWLFKPVGELDSVAPDGKDWAEKLAFELARLFSVPAAPVELAILDGVPGSICCNVNPAALPIQSGALLINDLDPDFDMRARDAAGHSLEAIRTILEPMGVPLSFDGPENFSAFDVFSGYLAFDALIANRDRHSQNWSVVLDNQRAYRLMETYDHGSGLGFSLSDAKRAQMLQDPHQFDAFVNRGRAYRFEGGKKVSLVDMAVRALSMSTPLAKAHWLDRWEGVPPSSIAAAIADIPRMSEVNVRFTTALVQETRRRLVDALR